MRGTPIEPPTPISTGGVPQASSYAARAAAYAGPEVTAEYGATGSPAAHADLRAPRSVLMQVRDQGVPGGSGVVPRADPEGEPGTGGRHQHHP